MPIAQLVDIDVGSNGYVLLPVLFQQIGSSRGNVSAIIKSLHTVMVSKHFKMRLLSRKRSGRVFEGVLRSRGCHF